MCPNNAEEYAALERLYAGIRTDTRGLHELRDRVEAICKIDSNDPKTLNDAFVK
eukprot:SAG11_NODE_3282_length_2553_cov_1.743684_2_plen_54_part_00